MSWFLYLWTVLALACAAIFVASIAMAKLLSASEPDWHGENGMKGRM